MMKLAGTGDRMCTRGYLAVDLAHRPIGGAEHDEEANGNPTCREFWFNYGIRGPIMAGSFKGQLLQGPCASYRNIKLKKALPFFFSRWNVQWQKVYAESRKIEFEKRKSFQLLRGHIPFRHPLSAPRGLTPFSLPSIIVLASGARDTKISCKYLVLVNWLTLLSWEKYTPNHANWVWKLQNFSAYEGAYPLRHPLRHRPSFQRQKNDTGNSSGKWASVRDWGGCKGIDMIEQTFIGNKYFFKIMLTRSRL